MDTTSVPHDSPQTRPSMQCMDGIICGANSIQCVRNEVINWQVAINATLDQLRHITPTFEASERRAFPRTACDQLEWPSADLMTTRSNSNHARSSPTSMATLKGSTHNTRILRGVMSEVFKHGGIQQR